MKIYPYFEWLNFRIGLFYDRKDRILYIGILPMIGLKILLPFPHYLIYGTYITDKPIGCCADPSNISDGERAVKSKSKDCPICGGRRYDSRIGDFSSC